MGSFYTAGKNGYFWRLLNFLQDKHVYDNDRRVLPYTPALLQDYIDFFPDQYSAFPTTVLSVYINNNFVTSANLNVPSGLLYVKLPVPKGDFTLQVRTQGGQVLRNEFYTAKNYAMFMEVAAQSYEERRVLIEQVIKDLDYLTIRSDRVYQVAGVFFDFPPPPGWTNQEYRDTVLGSGCKPGFVKSFFHGGTIKGLVDTIASITCDAVEVGPIQDGDRWVVFTDADAPNPLDTASPDAWFVSDADDIPLPNHRCLVMEDTYVASAIKVKVHGALRTVTDEDVLKATNSYIESRLAEPFNIAGKTLTFSIGGTSYTTLFGGATTTAAQAVADILAQNPSLTSAVYATGGRVRLGAAPSATQVIRVQIKAGDALPDLGFTVGQFNDVTWDQLANPNQTTPVVLTYGVFSFVEGVDFTVDQATGRIVWQPSSLAFPNIPPQGAVFKASYQYLMKREIETMAERAKDPSLTVEYVYV